MADFNGEIEVIGFVDMEAAPDRLIYFGGEFVMYTNVGATASGSTDRDSGMLPLLCFSHYGLPRPEPGSRWMLAVESDGPFWTPFPSITLTPVPPPA